MTKYRDHLPINVRTSLLETFGVEVTWNFGTYINIGIVVAYVSIINIRYNWKRTLLSVITNNTTVIERSFYMPENKLEILSSLSSWLFLWFTR